MNELSKTINLRIKGNDYLVKFPNVGQIIDIESSKTLLSRGQYRNLVSSMTSAAIIALDNIDMISTFKTLIPKLMEDLRVDSILDLDIMSAKELCDLYKEQFLPWYNKWIDVISGKEDKEEKKEKEDVEK